MSRAVALVVEQALRLKPNQRNRIAAVAGLLLVAAVLAACPWLLTNLFSTSYLPHGFCFLWNPRLLWLHVISDSIIWLSYTAIAITLAVLVRVGRPQIRFELVFVLFGSFIIACGFTHFLDVVLLWKPYYWLDGDLKLLTAGVSLITAVSLPFYLPRLKSTLNRAELSAENERRFMAAMNSSLDSFYILESMRDASGEIFDFRYRFMNSLGASLLKRSASEILGLSICDVAPDNRSSGLLEKYKQVVATGEPYVDELSIDYVAASWIKLQAVKLDDGVAITVSDISERKHREEKTAENERRFLAVTGSSLDGLSLMQSVRNIDGEIADFRIVFVNRNAARMVNLAPQSMIGQLLCELMPQRREQGLFAIYKHVAESGEPFVSEFPVDKVHGMTAEWLKIQVVQLDDGVAITASDISERKRREEATAANERRFLAAAELSLDSFFILESIRDPAGEIVDFRFTFLNTRGAAIIFHKPEEVLGQALCELLPENRAGGFFDIYKRVVETGEPFADEFSVDFKSLNASWLKLQVVKLEDGVAITSSDITDRKRLEMEKTRAFTESLIFNSPAAVIVTDVDHTITAINPAAEKMLWYKPEELVNRATPLVFYDASQIEDRAARLSAELSVPMSPEDAIFASGHYGSSEHEGEWTFIRNQGSSLAVNVAVTPLQGDQGQPAGFMITAYDISERKRREDYISHLAHHDLLTGLPTRQLLMDRLSMVMARSERFNTRCALLIIDLNNFKQVNDSFGHHSGDKLLVQVAERLRSTLRAIDTVARMGGDEFVVLLADLEKEEDAEDVAAKLLAAFATPFTLNEQNRVRMTASIGICVFPDGGADRNALLRNADAAMFQAKAKGQNIALLFSREVAQLAIEKLELETALFNALDAEEFVLHYQPQVSLLNGEMIGVEALLRWNSKKLGMVQPLRFIPLAEKSGLIIPIGAWVIQRACKDLRKLHDQFGRHLVMAVNLSARQLDQPDLLQVIETALRENGIEPTCFEIEITESLLMSDSPHASLFFDGLRKLGVRVAIDDFGTGFSSMSYLLRFSVDRLKVDRCFIQHCSTDANSATITHAIVTLAHQLHASVLAEGVETQEQMDYLKDAGCDDVQGYYLSRPVTLDLIFHTMNA